LTDNRTGPFWADNPFWSSLLLRLSALTYRHGADLTEVATIASTIESGDKDQWYKSFTATAEQLEIAASDEGKPALTRRDALWRASMYHRYAGAILPPLDPRAVDALAARRCAFGEAAVLHPPRIESVEVPVGDDFLPGWLCHGDRSDPNVPAPLVIVVGGTDGSAEEMYFAVGNALTELGYAVLTFDGPGQGEALRRGITARPDFETVIAAIIDHVAARPDIDESRIGLVGHSLGGLYATRAAAFEPRIRSTVVSSAPEAVDGIFSGPELVSEADDPVMNFLQTMFLAVTGSDTAQQAADTLALFRLGDAAGRIEIPLLALYGGDDGMVDVGVGERMVAAVPASDKRLVVFPSGTPGSHHCQQDSLAAAELELGAWISRTV
jgi:pimeloyl-ACP methyl ester carboxylesterase